MSAQSTTRSSGAQPAFLSALVQGPAASQPTSSQPTPSQPSQSSRVQSAVQSTSALSGSGRSAGPASTVGPWSCRVKAYPLHADDVHCLLRFQSGIETWLFSAGKDGSVLATGPMGSSSGPKTTEVCPARAKNREFSPGPGGLSRGAVPVWITAMALHPGRPEVAVAYRDGLIARFDVTKPSDWKPLEGLSASYKSDEAKANQNEARVYSLLYTKGWKQDGSDGVLLAGRTDYLKILRIDQSGAALETDSFKVKGLEKHDQIDALAELQPGRLALVAGRRLRVYGFEQDFRRAQPLVTTQLLEAKAGALFKAEWKKLATWKTAEKGQGVGVRLLGQTDQGQGSISVVTQGGCLEQFAYEERDPGSKAATVREGSGSLTQTLLVKDVALWGLNEYPAYRDGSPNEMNSVSRRCWDLCDLGHDTVAVGTDHNGIALVDLKAKKVAHLSLGIVGRAASLCWDATQKVLYTHVAPAIRLKTNEPITKKNFSPQLLAIELTHRDDQPAVTTMPTAPAHIV